MLDAAEGGGKSTLAQYLLYSREANWHTCLVRGSDTLDRVSIAHAIISQHFPEHRFEKERSCIVLDEILCLYRNNGKLAVIIVDDFHKLGADSQRYVLELAMKSEKETQFRIVLFQIESAHEKFQRLAERFRTKVDFIHLSVPLLSRQQTKKYIKHCISQVGSCDIDPFDEAAVEEIFRGSSGIPTQIRTLSRKLMQIYEIPGRNRRVAIQRLGFASLALVVSLVFYAAVFEKSQKKVIETDRVSIALNLPGSMQADSNIKSEQRSREGVKKAAVSSKTISNNLKTLSRDKKRQIARVVKRKQEAKKREMMRYQIASLDKLSLKVSDVIQN